MEGRGRDGRGGSGTRLEHPAQESGLRPEAEQKLKSAQRARPHSLRNATRTQRTPADGQKFWNDYGRADRKG